MIRPISKENSEGPLESLENYSSRPLWKKNKNIWFLRSKNEEMIDDSRLLHSKYKDMYLSIYINICIFYDFLSLSLSHTHK